MAVKECNGWVAILDILGFSDMMNRKDKWWIYENIVVWIKERINELVEMENSSAEETDAENWEEGGFDSRHAPVGAMFFADTIILYTDESRVPAQCDWSFRIITKVMSKFLNEALSKEIVLRGAVSNGNYLIDDKFPAIIGKCVVEAHQLEIAQRWAGISISSTALTEPQKPFQRYVNKLYEEYEANKEFHYPEAKIISYSVPFKNNWPSRWCDCRDEWARVLKTSSNSKLINCVDKVYDQFATKEPYLKKDELKWVIDWEPKIEILEKLITESSGHSRDMLENTYQFIKQRNHQEKLYNKSLHRTR